jgi:hypothetical protein
MVQSYEFSLVFSRFFRIFAAYEEERHDIGNAAVGCDATHGTGLEVGVER